MVAAQGESRLMGRALQVESEACPGTGRFHVPKAQGGFRVATEGEQSTSPASFRLGTKMFEERIVAIENYCAIWHQSLKDLRLRIRDVRDAVEELDMHGLDGRHDGDMRAHHRRERPDLAGVVHADLAHGKVRVGRHARKRQGHAPMVVEGGVGRMDLAGRREDGTKHLLRAGLADAARHAHDDGLRARPCSVGQLAQGFEDVGNEVLAPSIADESRDHGAGRAGVERCLDEVVPVEAIPGDGEEGVAGRERPTVDGDPGDVARAAARVAGHRGLDFGRRPEGRGRHACVAPARSATAARTTS